MKKFASTAVVVAAALALASGPAQAQYAIQNTGAPVYPTSGWVSPTFYGTAYPSGFAVGTDAAANRPAVRRPDGSVVYPPNTGATALALSCLSADGSWCAGVLTLGNADKHVFRWELPSPANGFAESWQMFPAAAYGFTYLTPSAVASDGTMVVTSNDYTVGVFRPDMQLRTFPVRYGPLAPAWCLTSCRSIEPNGDGTYTALGVGTLGYSVAGFALTGPLPN